MNVTHVAEATAQLGRRYVEDIVHEYLADLFDAQCEDSYTVELISRAFRDGQLPMSKMQYFVPMIFSLLLKTEPEADTSMMDNWGSREYTVEGSDTGCTWLEHDFKHVAIVRKQFKDLFLDRFDEIDWSAATPLRWLKYICALKDENGYAFVDTYTDSDKMTLLHLMAAGVEIAPTIIVLGHTTPESRKMLDNDGNPPRFHAAYNIDTPQYWRAGALLIYAFGTVANVVPGDFEVLGAASEFAFFELAKGYNFLAMLIELVNFAVCCCKHNVCFATKLRDMKTGKGESLSGVLNGMLEICQSTGKYYHYDRPKKAMKLSPKFCNVDVLRKLIDLIDVVSRDAKPCDWISNLCDLFTDHISPYEDDTAFAEFREMLTQWR